METVQQNGRFTLFSIKFLSIYSILYAYLSDLPTFQFDNQVMDLDPLDTFIIILSWRCAAQV